MRPNEFADPSRIAKWTEGLWVALTVAEGLQLVGYLLQRQFVFNARSGAYGGRPALLAAAHANDIRSGILGMAAGVLLIPAFIMFLRWVHRAMFNVRCMGAVGVETPGWAVGYFFMPIANLFMPYVVMSQIWRGSADAFQWSSLRAPSLVLMWWACQIILSVCAVAIVFQAMSVRSLDALETMTDTLLVVSVLEIIRNLLTILLVSRVSRMQITQHANHPTGVF